MASKSIGIVIRTLNESELIGQCLDTLHGQRGSFDLDVVVVDSGSIDSTVEIARSHDARIVELAPGDFDYSKALNVGVDQVHGDIVVSLSAHAIPVDDQWIERMTAPFDDANVAGVSCRQIPWPNAPWQERHRLRGAFGSLPAVYRQDNDGEIVFSNAASSFRRSVWRAEPFKLRAVEDLEWARRVIAKGWMIIYEPGAAVYHSHHESPRAQARRMIDINRAHDAEDVPRARWRTLHEAAGYFLRDSRAILALNESSRLKLRYLAELLRVVCYYVADFSRVGTTAEHRRRDSRGAS